jgi:hypothetical protein
MVFGIELYPRVVPLKRQQGFQLGANLGKGPQFQGQVIVGTGKSVCLKFRSLF